ncbi:tetratricopeptide repeat protein [Halomonas sp. BN3-1]|nr:tetratricopeptide repeat protein [Halomonas sp. BN3-1]
MRLHRPRPARQKSAQDALQQARRRTQQAPDDAESWRQLAAVSISRGELEKAIDAVRRVIELSKDDAPAFAQLGQLLFRQGHYLEARQELEHTLSLAPDQPKVHMTLCHIMLSAGQLDGALHHAEQGLSLSPDDPAILCTLAEVASALYDLEQARELYRRASKLDPDAYIPWNNLGGVERQLGNLDQALTCYQRAREVAPSHPTPLANLITTLHYQPGADPARIRALCQQANVIYCGGTAAKRASTARLGNKPLRLGFLSDGFHSHPVAKMITSALERVSNQPFSLYFYSTSRKVDQLTRRLKKLAYRWTHVDHLDDKALVTQVRDDGIDILFDLCGHMAGTRMSAMALQPAPLIVKWVGGLINTTGVEAIDYLLSDAIETPPGCDDDYVEKLIRLPDDYICYEAPPYTPEVNALPAKTNGYITLGCFNNGTKLNEVVLGEWATLMHQLPDSRLLLKSQQFKGSERAASITAFMEARGITAERIMIEGPSPHGELLRTYHRVDIALDPWPYSGGLTTCEAFTMGVPVVSLPGPTFAGRHSATHLINAGMPELVVSSWDEYRERVLELAADLDSLATIRRHLREVLLGSPVCDAKRFARHFTTAVRAIWQRHCEGKPPAALTFDKEGQATFEGDSAPVAILPVEPHAETAADDGFRWNFEGRVIVVDSGARLLKTGNPRALLDLDAFGVVAFDPASQVKKPEFLKTRDDVDLFAHACLGDGNPGELHATLNGQYSSLLEPEAAECLPYTLAQPMRSLTRLPISTIALDSIEGLPTIDWLSLDLSGDTMAILENGEKVLENALLLQIQVPFQPLYQRQADFAQVSHWAHRHGFQFYRFNAVTPVPVEEEASSLGASEWLYADALFVPSPARQAALEPNRLSRLAFVMHTVFQAKDLAWKLLKRAGLAERYLEEECNAKLGLPQGAPNDKEVEQAINLPDAPFMTPPERQLFLKALRKAKHYFEFGAGGSTIWAVREGLVVQGVESDATWVTALADTCGEKCQLRSVDIGPTKEWGFPVNTQPDNRFEAYSKAIYDMPRAFDLVLIDGRFRVACTLTTILHTMEHAENLNNTRIFIHDFWDRPHYHSVLKYLEIVERVDTAGIFIIKEGLSTEHLQQEWENFKHVPA